MKSLNISYFAQSRAWWVVALVGILLVLSGFTYWLWPAAGYAVASQLFGWLLVLTGIVQLCVASGPNHARQWGWWLVGGVLDLFIGFMLVRSVILSESVLPYFLAFLFLYWGIESFVKAGYGRSLWLNIINGVLLLVIGFFFLEAGYVSNMWMVSFLTSIAFIYWGFTVALAGFSMKPRAIEGQE